MLKTATCGEVSRTAPMFYSQSGGGSLRSMAKPRLAVAEEGEGLIIGNSNTREADVATSGEAAK